ncbi:IS110 family transposase [Roseomonas chloroacetimidivorans]|uniref:IS110 family transposase n=1 Tax=Roseomonas chloroacetimidivorans TaxID=1766656 RepID=UPI003C73CF28
MLYYGRDVSPKQTALCFVDGEGRVAREARLATDPEVISRSFQENEFRCERIGLESRGTFSLLCLELGRLGRPAVCIGARHAAAALQAGFRNKNDRNDARGIAELMRVKTYREVWIKSQESQRRGMLLTDRGTLHRQRVALENTIRGLLCLEGSQFPTRGSRFAEDVLERIDGSDALHLIIRPLLEARATMMRQILALDRQIITTAQQDPVCRLLMTIPGVGAHTALSFKACVDDPARFRRSRTVGAHFGLTPRQYSSGEVNIAGRISKMGNRGMRRLLYVAANAMMTRGRWSALKAWAMRLAKARGARRAKVALARRLAVTMHAMWWSGDPSAGRSRPGLPERRPGCPATLWWVPRGAVGPRTHVGLVSPR